VINKPRVRKSLLLGAFFQQEAEIRQLLAGRGVHTADEVEDRIARWRKGREAFEQSQEWGNAEPPEVQDLPPELVPKVEELAQTDLFRSSVQGLPYVVAVVSLGELTAFQFTVDKPYCDTFTVPAGRSLGDVAGITLPTEPPKFPLRVGADGLGFTVSAPGPNLRVAGMEFKSAEVGSMRLTVDLTFGSPFVQVAEFQGRLILRNGYHRLVSLLHQGVNHAPVILLHGTDYSQTGAAGPGFFQPSIVMGAKPPLLKHYLSSFAIEFDAVDLHKTIRLRPDEFQVPVPE